MMRATVTIARSFALAVVVVGIVWTAPARAANPAPAWRIRSVAQPTNFAPGDESGDDAYEVTLTNSGGATSSGTPIAVITDTLPAGLTVKSIEMEIYLGSQQFPVGSELCASGKAGASVTVTCTLPEGFKGVKALAPSEGLVVIIHVAVPTSASGPLVNAAQAQGGGAPMVSTSSNNVVSSAPAGAGFSEFHAELTGVDGLSDSQAGSHPYEFVTSFALNTALGLEGKVEPAAGDVKDVRVALPPGLAGNPTVAPRCTAQQFNTRGPGSTAEHSYNDCPNGSVVGLIEAHVEGGGRYVEPVYNLVPPAGMPAQLGFQVQSAEFYVDTKVRTEGDYGITGYLTDVTEVQRVTSATVTLWGVPAEPVHDLLRGSCLSIFGASLGSCPAGVAAKPFLRLPTSCAGTLSTEMRFDTWSSPDETLPLHESSVGASPGECSALQFSPTIAVRPTSTVADSPTGLHVDLHVPQSEDPGGLAEADLKDATVTLPAGVVVNPSQASGLVGCPLEGPEGVNLKSPQPGHCPDASTIGSVEVNTPLLEKPLTGAVYVAQQGNAGPAQGSNPFGSLLAIYVVVEGSGVVVKLAGHVEVNPSTGQLATTFSENPQLPFEDFKLDFFNGPRAPLVTPPACGAYATTTSLTPWSAPDSGPPASPSDAFRISSGCSGGFSPSFTAGTTSNQAGGFSPLSVTLSRGDGEQRLAAVQVHMPPGLLGKIAGIPVCGEAQANAGTCSAASQIGTATAGAGAGPDPVFVPEAGQPPNPVYLTGPYRGAPFGLSIVTHALAGPFDLGSVIVRAAISIDPHTAQITVSTDPSGPYGIPTILQGIPLDLRTVNVTTNRPGFMFNATNCAAMTMGATITSTTGASAGVTSPYHAVNCAVLPFKPTFTVSTQGKTSKANGASLDVKVAQKPGEANIQKVDVSLPLALPSRLTTLQKACSETQFAANPAGCPAGSLVGTATAHTPVLNAPLTGPAFLVSHGGAAFPDLDVVLQGEGIEIELVGNTDIKKGITFSRFETVPDAPISTFELNLPESPHSVLAAVGNLCDKSLVMPTTIVGQNGAQVTHSTKISVTGCPPTVKVKKARVSGNTLLVTVTTTQKGTVAVSGKGLKTTKKTLVAGTHQIKVRLTNIGIEAVKHHKKTKIEVSARNAQGAASTTTSVRL
jgi:uncharacterized repeat protein (TIGR01451 family)